MIGYLKKQMCIVKKYYYVCVYTGMTFKIVNNKQEQLIGANVRLKTVYLQQDHGQGKHLYVECGALVILCTNIR